MFYTYFHTRNDTGAAFYVGKGKGRRSHDCDRNQHWSRIVAKHGHTVHIAARWPTEAEAFEHEKFLIACFRDMCVPLCNMTDGGEGSSGLTWSEEARMSFSERRKAEVTPESRERSRVAALGNRHAAGHTLVHTPETKAKISEAGIGRVASLAARQKISAAKLGNKCAAGVARSAEFKAAVSARFLGKPKSPEHKAKMLGNLNCLGKQNFLGYTHTAEAKEKIGLASRSRSKESLDKQAASLRENWAKRKAAQCQN